MFRILIIVTGASLLLSMASVFGVFPVSAEEAAVQETMELVALAEESEGVPWGFLGIGVLGLGAYIAGLAGMYFFQRWARTAYVISLLVVGLLSLALGGIYLSPFASFVSDLRAMADGALLVMVFLTPVGDKFVAKNLPTPVE